MKIALLIAAAGALGTLARYLVGLGAQRWLGAGFPYGTLTVNLVGSFAMGAAMAYFASRGALGAHLRIALTVGFLGGFTTYSSFALETVELIERRQLGVAALYVGGTLVTAALACYAGMAVARASGS